MGLAGAVAALALVALLAGMLAAHRRALATALLGAGCQPLLLQIPVAQAPVDLRPAAAPRDAVRPRPVPPRRQAAGERRPAGHGAGQLRLAA
jgi:hypothetical protein